MTSVSHHIRDNNGYHTGWAAEIARGSNRRAVRVPRISRAELSGRSWTRSGVLRSGISEIGSSQTPAPSDQSTYPMSL